MTIHQTHHSFISVIHKTTSFVMTAIVIQKKNKRTEKKSFTASTLF